MLTLILIADIHPPFAFHLPLISLVRSMLWPKVQLTYDLL